MRLCAVLLLLACFSAHASAQMGPGFAGGDTRIRTIDYRRDQVVRIDGTPGYQITIELAPDEQVENVAVGDSAAWQVTVNRTGNLLFLKPLQDSAGTNMTVVTNARFYAFDLSTGGAEGASPYGLRFRYPPQEALLTGPGQLGLKPPEVGEYRLRGAKELRPARMSDDGNKTYIDWPSDAALPAVFTVDRRGRETLANGNMRNGLYVIDSVEERLVFRLDNMTMRADRMAAKKPTPRR